MAAFLTIKGKEIEAKCTFGFQALADKKYSKKKEASDPDNGFESIYTGLLEYSNDALVAFWECATTYLGKNDRPSVQDIQEALEARFEEDGDTETATREAFNAIDESSFFKKKASTFWKNVESMKDFGETDEERKQSHQTYKLLTEAKNEVKGSI